jgi:CRP-like cAMP-binding protein
VGGPSARLRDFSVTPDHTRLSEALGRVGGLEPPLARRVVASFLPRELQPGQRLFPPGSVCSGVGFVCRGLLASHSLMGAAPVVADLFCEGDFATDYVSFLTGQPSTVDVEALEPCRILWLPHASLQELYEQFPPVERLGRLLAEAQFMGVVRRTSALLTQSPAERYRDLVATRPEVANRVPQYLLARWLGVAPESLSRIRGRLARLHRISTTAEAREPSKSKAPSAKLGGPRRPRAPREKP